MAETTSKFILIALLLILSISACLDLQRSGVQVLTCSNAPCGDYFYHNTTYEYVQSVSTGDLNGDGIDDILTTSLPTMGENAGTQTMWLYTKGGESMQTTIIGYLNYTTAALVEIGDANNDGDTDFVVSQWLNNDSRRSKPPVGQNNMLAGDCNGGMITVSVRHHLKKDCTAP